MLAFIFHGEDHWNFREEGVLFHFLIIIAGFKYHFIYAAGDRLILRI